MTDQVSRADLDAAVAEARRYLAEQLGLVPDARHRAAAGRRGGHRLSLFSTIAAKIVLGWIFLIGGVVLVVHAFSTRDWRASSGVC